MCGIVGMVGARAVSTSIYEGLQQLEYRGYDSSGIATLSDGSIHRQRAQGKLINLKKLLEVTPLVGDIGIGHTRWATHGAPSEINAHPHATDRVAVVHNGIIENFIELRAQLTKQGYSFKSETDTEVVPVLITSFLDAGLAPKDAVQEALQKLHGAFALGILIKDTPTTLYAARQGAPLALGVGKGEMLLASDAMALAKTTQNICYLEDGDWAVLTPQSYDIYLLDGTSVSRPVTKTAYTGEQIGKGNHAHYMLKEIYEQPSVMGEALSLYINATDKKVHLPDLPFDLTTIKRICLVACGTSFYAANVAKYWLEELVGIPVEVDIASEYRYRTPYYAQDGLFVCISQSGETADTLAALRMAKQNKQNTLAIVNVAESTMAKEAHAKLLTHAGPEIGVASTKAFTAQITTLACLVLALAQARKLAPESHIAHCLHALAEAPARMLEVLHMEETLAALSKQILVPARDVLYIGRGTSYPIALEGALKLKEISYIHAEAYAAGELKHGPIALIDDLVPIVALAPQDKWYDKTASNVQEAAARGGKILLITDHKGAQELKDIATATLVLPNIDPFVAPLLYAIPMQLLAYHTAVAKGTDVDQPRNLAKSVTVE